MAGKTGNQKIIEQFLVDGMNVMFGNPGTVEQGFLDALRDYPEIRYILTLQESVPIMMADAYARATKKPALAQIHSTPGLGNAIGAMYQAMRGHAPIVIIGGDAGLSYMNMEAQMYGDLVGMARPVTKWATMVTDEHSLLRTIRRAIKIASTPPMGPVYVCLPADVLDKINDEPVFPSCRVEPPAAPAKETVRRIAKALLDAKDPTIFIGDGVAYSHAQEEVAELAQLLGAPVWGVDSGELNMDTTHPCYMGQTGHMFGSSSLPITKRGDAALITGTYMLPEVYPELGSIYRDDAVVIHVDSDPDAIAKNHRVDIGVTADPKVSLAAIIGEIKEIRSETDAKEAAARIEALTAGRNKPDFTSRSAVCKAFLETLAEANADLVIFDEALTGSDMLNHYLPPSTPERFFQTRGGSLGVGIPGAMALKMAFPDKTVIGFTGDGGSMYTIQALWTAAHYGIDAKFVVLSNRAYGLLKNNINQYWKTQNITPHEYPDSFSITNPNLDFVSLAEGQGVEAVQAATEDDARKAAKAMLASKGAFLVDIVI